MKAKIFLSTVLFCYFHLFLNAQNLEIYVSDAGGFNNGPWQIMKFDENGDNPEVFIDDSLAWPQDIVFLEDQEIVLISNLSSGQINRHNAETGAYIDMFAAVPGGPTRMAIGNDDLIYVLQWLGTGPVLRYDQDGNFVDEFTDTGILQAIGMAWDDDGRLYVSSYGGDVVQRFNSDGTFEGSFIESNLVGPTNIWFEENGNLLVSDYNAGSIKRFDSEGNYLGVYIPSLTQPEGIAYLPNGDLLVGNGGDGTVKRFDTEGEFIDDFIPAGTTPGLMTPNAVVIRDISTSIDSGLQNDLNFIVPSVGNSFYADVNTASTIESVSVYSPTGQHVVTQPVTDRLIWDASSYSDGVYVVSITLRNGKTATQKVVVQTP